MWTCVKFYYHKYLHMCCCSLFNFRFSLEKLEIHSTNTANSASSNIWFVLNTLSNALTNWPLALWHCQILLGPTFASRSNGRLEYSISVHLYEVTIYIIRSASPVFVNGKSTTDDLPSLREPMLKERFLNVISSWISK